MASKNHWFTRITRPYLPDKQSLTIFLTAIVSSAALTTFNNLAIISDASASIEPVASPVAMVSEQVHMVTPPPPNMELDFPPALLETAGTSVSVIDKPLMEAVKAETTVTKAPVMQVKASPKKQRSHNKAKLLRMKIIGTQDGIAWYINKSGDVLQAKVGDSVPGIGTLGVIHNDRTIKTADGQQVIADSVF